MKKSIVLGIVCFMQLELVAQGNQLIYPEVGKPCPDFVFNDVEYFRQEKVTLKDFKGKWLIIDCWNRWCAGCIASFPRTDSLQKEFSNKVQFLLVGYTGTQYVPRVGGDEQFIKALYRKLRQREGIRLPIAYDSVFFHRFDIQGCPFVIVIDPRGIVRSITFQLKRDQLQGFLDGKNPALDKAYRAHEEGSSWRKYHTEYHPDSIARMSPALK